VLTKLKLGVALVGSGMELKRSQADMPAIRRIAVRNHRVFIEYILGLRK